MCVCISGLQHTMTLDLQRPLTPTSETDPRGAPRTVVLVGNPNVGKSVLFKNLTDHYVTVSNFPGTTVEVARARSDIAGRRVQFLDTPGVNDLWESSDVARVTRDLVSDAEDAILVQVADAKNLRRALLLTLQLAELGEPMLLVLNMADELEKRGGHIDVDKLSEILGIPVVESVAVRGWGTAQIREKLPRARTPRVEQETVEHLSSAYEKNRVRLERVNEILAETYSVTQPKHASFGVRLGFWATHPVKGLAFLAATLLATFWFVGLLGAGTLVDLLEVGLFEQRLSPVAIATVDRLLPFPHDHEITPVSLTLGVPVTPVHEVSLGEWERTVATTDYVPGPGERTATQEFFRFVHDLLVGEYGTLTMAISYALAIILPIVTTFFLVFSLLEDSGYLPRLAILANRLFRLIGLNGRAVLPMILGLGCDTMATMTTRILDTRRERLITTMLLALTVPCSAQLGVLLAMMASLSPAAAVLWATLMFGILLLVGWLTSRVFDGETSDFILEIPPMRQPQPGNVFRKTLGRLNWYLREVIPLFVVGTAVLFLLARLGLLARIADAARPVVTGWLGLPGEMATAFLVGFMRRDFGAVYLLDAATGPDPILTTHQIFVAMITITLFMPCFANFLMIAKEHGQKIAWSMAAFIFPFAILIGGLVHHIGRWLG